MGLAKGSSYGLKGFGIVLPEFNKGLLLGS
jgi:hypothetical protein